MAKKPSPEKRTKLRPDVNEVAHRVMLEATGQAPKTLPPGERSGDQKNPEAVARGGILLDVSGLRAAQPGVRADRGR